MNRPSVTMADVVSAIQHDKTTYTVLPDGRTTICQLTLDNGYTVDGHSACVCPENFDAKTGQEYAYEKAVEKIWPLLGFRLADRLHRGTCPEPDAQEQFELAFGQIDRGIHRGDNVWFYERQPNGVLVEMLALVTNVVNHRHVNVTIFAPNGTTHARINVQVLDPMEEAPEDVPYFVREWR